jgi:hypothetical protein
MSLSVDVDRAIVPLAHVIRMSLCIPSSTVKTDWMSLPTPRTTSHSAPVLGGNSSIRVASLTSVGCPSGGSQYGSTWTMAPSWTGVAEVRWVGFDGDSMHAHRIYWQDRNHVFVERDVRFTSNTVTPPTSTTLSSLSSVMTGSWGSGPLAPLQRAVEYLDVKFVYLCNLAAMPNGNNSHVGMLNARWSTLDS